MQAADGEEALDAARQHLPDLILLDIMMPKLDGIEVCRRLKGDAALPFMPIILVTAKADSKDVVAGLEAGADEYLTKPIDQTALVARVKSVLRLKALHDQVSDQAAELLQWNQTLERRVADQVGEIERVSRLKRFLAPQVADLVMTSGDEGILKSRRRAITVVFCDLRGFTAFTSIRSRTPSPSSRPCSEAPQSEPSTASGRQSAPSSTVFTPEECANYFAAAGYDAA